jgi:hypothetical protein
MADIFTGCGDDFCDPYGIVSCLWSGFRWFRYAQPPANFCDASGVDCRMR